MQSLLKIWKREFKLSPRMIWQPSPDCAALSGAEGANKSQSWASQLSSFQVFTASSILSHFFSGCPVVYPFFFVHVKFFQSSMWTIWCSLPIIMNYIVCGHISYLRELVDLYIELYFAFYFRLTGRRGGSGDCCCFMSSVLSRLF